MLLTLRGTPVLYMGEEFGLADADVPSARAVDPGGRDGCRAPLPWDAAPGHGWAAALRFGELTLLPSCEEVLAFRRECREKDADARVIAVNFGSRTLEFDPGEPLSVELASNSRGDFKPFRGRLDADQAVILR